MEPHDPSKQSAQIAEAALRIWLPLLPTVNVQLLKTRRVGQNGHQESGPHRFRKRRGREVWLCAGLDLGKQRTGCLRTTEQRREEASGMERSWDGA